MTFDRTTLDFAKNDGLIPAILQHARTGQVLMLGYMNQEALELTLTEGVAWFYSRSKKRLWKKGETSNHVQKVVDIQADCDNDTLLVFVEPQGPTCHLGSQSCFGDTYFNLAVLEETVREKMAAGQEGSYTKYLVDQGIDKILKKNGEEMTEVIIAAKNQEKSEFVAEMSDLLYHLMVLIQSQGVNLADIEAKLAERHGQKQHYSQRTKIEEW